MKQLLFFAIIFFSLFSANAQMGIGTTTPHASAQLDVSSTNKGFLPPRIALNGILDNSTIVSPADGLLIYNTATAGSFPENVTPGYYYFNGSMWVCVGAGKFVDLTTAQVIAAPKVFAEGLTVANKPFLPSKLSQDDINALTGVEEGMMVYNTTTRKLQVYSVSANNVINELYTGTYSAGADYIQQSFLAPTAGQISQIQIFAKSGNGSMPFAMIDCAINENFVGGIFIPDLSTAPQWYAINLNNPVTVIAGQTMNFRLNGPDLLMGGCVLGTNSTYAAGSITSFNGGTLNGDDLMFRILITPSSGAAYWINMY